MNELIADYIDGILADVVFDVRSGRRLIALVGMLGDTSIPEDISKEAMKLSKLLVLREMFNSLIEPVSAFAKRKELVPIDRQMAHSEMNFKELFAQIDETRKQIAEYDSINYPLIIAWVIAEAKKQKLIRKVR
jgi:hypothetical protein